MKVVGQIFYKMWWSALRNVFPTCRETRWYLSSSAPATGGEQGRDVLVAMTCVKINRCVGGTR